MAMGWLPLSLLAIFLSGVACIGPTLRGVFDEVEPYELRDENLSADVSEVSILLDIPQSTHLVPKISTYSPQGVLDVSVRHSTGKSLIWRNQPGYKSSRYICHTHLDTVLLITVSTFNSSDVTFDLTASLEDISIEIEEEISATVSSGSPVVRRFTIPPEWKDQDHHLTVALHSNCSNCGLLGIQTFSCPFYDVESSLVFRAKWQAYMGLAAINIRTSDVQYNEGFYIILITKTNSDICVSGASKNLEENVSLGVSKDVILTVHKEDYYPFGTSIGIVFAYLLVYGIGIAFTLFSSMPVEGKVAIKLRPNMQGKKSRCVEDGDLDERKSLDYVDSVPSPSSGSPTKVNRSTSTADFNSMKIKEILIIDKEELHKIRNQKDLTLKDLAITCDYDRFPHTLHMKSSLYVWIIFLMGIFYSLPVFQLVKNYEKLSEQSGDENICYYNFLCKVQWASLKDYGHVFSNIGYVISGLVFILIVSIRRLRYNAYMMDESKHRRGIPEQYGVFFAMGGALSMEGVLSGCYHICPTAENFQFDTTFMYVLAVLVFLKVFQFRHPDITANAYIVFAVIGGALVFEVVGIYLSNTVFWIVFLTSYILVVVFFVVQTYYNGMMSQFIRPWKLIFKNCIHQRQPPKLEELVPVRKGKFFASLVIIAVNITLAIYFAFKRKPGVSRYLLSILMINMALYVGYYICMKLFYRFSKKRLNEAIGWRSMIYFFCMNICLVSSVMFFVMELKNSSLSPAASREMNEPCLTSFFDNHDMWHFLSAAGLFFHFMMILTLEDENLDTPWLEIPVF